jgi:hypothetical protein
MLLLLLLLLVYVLALIYCKFGRAQANGGQALAPSHQLQIEIFNCLHSCTLCCESLQVCGIESAVHDTTA